MEEPMKKLYRSRSNRRIAGVCGGLAAYFNIDPTLVRLLFILGLLFVGGTLLAYIILMIVIPEEPA
jgi:phage shock protein PspC (stress-responsive transcriptional regulator)